MCVRDLAKFCTSDLDVAFSVSSVWSASNGVTHQVIISTIEAYAFFIELFLSPVGWLRNIWCLKNSKGLFWILTFVFNKPITTSVCHLHFLDSMLLSYYRSITFTLGTFSPSNWFDIICYIGLWGIDQSMGSNGYVLVFNCHIICS